MTHSSRETRILVNCLEVGINFLSAGHTFFIIQIIQFWLEKINVFIHLKKHLCFTVVEYKVADFGYLRYYLAPKIEDAEDS